MHEWVSFSEIKNRVTLERVLRSYRVDWLRRSGLQQYRGRCPIHQGQGVEAFHANLGRGVFHCFACGAGGNVLDFRLLASRGSITAPSSPWRWPLRRTLGCGSFGRGKKTGYEKKRGEPATALLIGPQSGASLSGRTRD
jgi:hypothetical protein